MIILGAAIWMPFTAILTVGLVIVLGHNALDFYEKQLPANHTYNIFYSFLHRPGLYPLGGGYSLLIFYPFLSWTGLMMLGYCFGKLFTRYEGAERKNVLTWLGVGIILFFIALRATNLYGDAQHWSQQKNGCVYSIIFYQHCKIPAITFVYVHDYWSRYFICCLVGKYEKWSNKIHYGLRTCAFLLLCDPFHVDTPFMCGCIFYAVGIRLHRVSIQQVKALTSFQLCYAR